MNVIKMTLSSENINRICKVCLEEKTTSISLSATIQLSNSPSTPIKFRDILAKLVPDALPDEYDPSLICMNCIEQLNSVYLFLLKYEESVRILKEFVKFCQPCQPIKHEYNNDTEIVLNNNENDVKIGNTVRKQRVRKKCTENANSGRLPTIKQKLHVCPICTKEFTALELREHAHTHKALKKYLNIPNEQKVTPTTRFYTTTQQENLTIFKQPNASHKCPFCEIELQAADFRLHVEQHRKHDEFQCDQCQRVFNRLSHLNIHRLKHMKEHPYECEYCNKGFVIKKNYDYHLLTHTETVLPHKCEYCLKRFANPEHLNRHSIIHTENVSYGVKYRVCRCYRCKRTFKDKDVMKNHQCVPASHQQKSKKLYTCKVCKKVYAHYSALYNHRLKNHHKEPPKALCSVCGKHVANIYNHMMRHNGIKPYKCNECEKCFSAKQQLRQHLLVHSGIRPYVCTGCGKSFNNLYNLQVHERIHRGDKCHICPLCGKGFLEKSYLKKHLNIHQKNG